MEDGSSDLAQEPEDSEASASIGGLLLPRIEEYLSAEERKICEDVYHNQ